ncbi:MAG TPA: HEAT repeat domain-containing protein, partial [Phycisphaerae bacterium]|nr:HEAT repeat domain-containing protein [Phycisphaerae bacterium]
MRTCLALLWIGLLAAFAAGQEDAAPPPGEGTTRPAIDARTIAALIRQLGDDKWTVREAATRELAKIGAPALPAVRRAMLSNDLEVRERAKIIYQEILGVIPKRLRASREEMLEAFDKGDYTKAIRIGERLTSSEGGGLLDWLRLGHASQLAGQWGSAVKAYQQVVGLIDADLAAGK